MKLRHWDLVIALLAFSVNSGLSGWKFGGAIGAANASCGVPLALPVLLIFEGLHAVA